VTGSPGGQHGRSTDKEEAAPASFDELVTCTDRTQRWPGLRHHFRMADSGRLAILKGPARSAARSVIADVASSLARLPKEEGGDWSLAGGAAGFAVFRSYMDAVHGRSGQCTDVAEMLGAAFEACEVNDPYASLYGGMAGIGWAMGLCGRLAGQAVDLGRLDLIDEAIVDVLSGWSWAGDYDLISGLVGVGVYGLSRMPSAAGRRIVGAVVERLGDGAESAQSGVTWKTPPELLPPDQAEVAPKGYYNLGMAHGVPGAIAFLAHASDVGVGGLQSRRLLEGAVGWVLAQRLDGSVPSVFPSWVGAGVSSQAARTAWCYGDPGIAVSLLAAADCANDAGWREQAVDLAAIAAARAPDETGVIDAGLCHGAAGLGHIFSRFYRASGSAKFASASRSWLGRAIRHLEDRRGADIPERDLGFIEGATGIGLALLTATSGTEPVWDAALLLSSAAP